MKLDVNALRYLSSADMRVLMAVELGQRNHELVPTPMIDALAGLKHGGTARCLSTLCKYKLVHHENQKYDGYRLTYLGYDYLAIKALTRRGVIASVGRQIGVGKESDIFEVANDDGVIMAMKLHRLGRTSFRAVKAKRDYTQAGHYSWLYLSRLAALKEFAFMRALGERGMPVPQAIDNNRHAVVMTLVDAHPLVQVKEVGNPEKVYQQLMDMMAKLAKLGLVHCDFNEFNLLIGDDERLTLIDFPQMVSVGHANAEELFYRDVECIIRFFRRKLGYDPDADPELRKVRPDFKALAAACGELDVELAASGFKRDHRQVLDSYDWQHDESDDGEEGSEAEEGSQVEEGSEAESDLEPESGEEMERVEEQRQRDEEEEEEEEEEGEEAVLAGMKSRLRLCTEVSASPGWLGGERAGEEGAPAGEGSGRAAEAEGRQAGGSGVGSEEDVRWSEEREHSQPSAHATAGELAADTDMRRQVQQRITEQRQKQRQKAAMHKASNSSKSKGRKGNKGNSKMATF